MMAWVDYTSLDLNLNKLLFEICWKFNSAVLFKENLNVNFHRYTENLNEGQTTTKIVLMSISCGSWYFSVLGCRTNDHNVSNTNVIYSKWCDFYGKFNNLVSPRDCFCILLMGFWPTQIPYVLTSNINSILILLFYPSSY